MKMRTSSKKERTRRPGPKRILVQVKRLETYINKMRIIPATELYRNAVILCLLSKALAVSRAVCVLVDSGFPTEAFGLSRTLVEIYFCLRYIGNKNSENRARTYVEYGARVRQEWRDLIQKYYPSSEAASLTLEPDILETAQKFKHKAAWTGHGGQAKMMALEADTREQSEGGQSVTGEFDYDFVYFWTSHFVHVTVEGLVGHDSPSGRIFKVRSQHLKENRYARLALVNVVSSLLKGFVSAFRAMNEEQPEEILQPLFRILSQLK